MTIPSRARARLLAFFLLVSGFCGISYEILYGRLIGNLVGDQFAVSAAVLLTFLLGIGVGSRAAHRFWPQLWAFEAAIGLCGVAAALAGPRLDGLLYAATGGQLGVILVICAVGVGLPAFLIGCTMPLFAGYLAT